MALGTILGALATAGISAGASKLFGGGGDMGDVTRQSMAPLQNFQPVNFSGGGLSSSFKNGSISLTPNAARTGAVRDLAGAFGGQADEIAALRPSVAPGFSDLRSSRLAEIENARTNAIGNLRENMARRRVLGSSFGADALARAENEFGQAKDRVAAESFLQELEATNNLINQEFQARRGQFQTGLDELNLEADLASKLAATATQQLGANARMESKLTASLGAEEAIREGKFFGNLIEPVSNAVGKGVTTLFSANPVAGAWGT